VNRAGALTAHYDAECGRMSGKHNKGEIWTVSIP
jgi:hypothetical protein